MSRTAKTVKIENVPTRIQIAYQHNDEWVRASVVKSAPGVYALRFRSERGETLTEMKADERITYSLDLDGLDGVHACKTHGPKIQRPAGHFDCEPCFRDYARTARERAKERKANGTQALSPAARREAERKAANDAKIDHLMRALESRGLALHQQASA